MRWCLIRNEMRKYILIFLASLVLFLVISPLRRIGLVYASIVETICYAVMTYILLKKYSKSLTHAFLIGGLILLGRVIVEIPLRMKDFEGTLMSLPGTLLACLTIALTVAVFISKKKKYIIPFSLIVWGYCVLGHKNLLEYIIWGSVPDTNVASFTIKTSEGNVTLGSLQNEYVLLDFWSSSCGVCYKKFPLLQSFFERAEKENSEIIVASVFVPYLKNEQEDKGKSIIDSLGYTFPVWSTPSKDSLLKTLDIDDYPTVILLDKDRNVVYKGSLESSIKKMKNLVDIY